MKAIFLISLILLFTTLVSCKTEGELFYEKALDENGNFIVNNPKAEEIEQPQVEEEAPVIELQDEAEPPTIVQGSQPQPAPVPPVVQQPEPAPAPPVVQQPEPAPEPPVVQEPEPEPAPAPPVVQEPEPVPPVVQEPEPPVVQPPAVPAPNPTPVPPADDIEPIGDVICDPLSVTENNNDTPNWNENNPAAANSGLVAELYYLTSTQPRFRSTAEYMVFGQRSAQTIFFSEIFVPTRSFSVGFPLATGGVVKTDQGDDLFEYFALKIYSTISLAPNEEPGLYEFALIADDGAVWKIQTENNELVTLVDNDHNHPSRMGCSTQTIYMDRNTKLKSIIEYYQGPRYHISLIPMWRKIDTVRVNEPTCGRRGNSLFFDYRNDSKPQKTYLDLLSRGWKALDKNNYMLPEKAGDNPCIQTEAE